MELTEGMELNLMKVVRNLNLHFVSQMLLQSLLGMMNLLQTMEMYEKLVPRSRTEVGMSEKVVDDKSV